MPGPKQDRSGEKKHSGQRYNPKGGRTKKRKPRGITAEQVVAHMYGKRMSTSEMIILRDALNEQIEKRREAGI